MPAKPCRCTCSASCNGEQIEAALVGIDTQWKYWIGGRAILADESCTWANSKLLLEGLQLLQSATRCGLHPVHVHSGKTTDWKLTISKVAINTQVCKVLTVLLHWMCHRTMWSAVSNGGIWALAEQTRHSLPVTLFQMSFAIGGVLAFCGLCFAYFTFESFCTCDYLEKKYIGRRWCYWTLSCKIVSYHSLLQTIL